MHILLRPYLIFVELQEGGSGGGSLCLPAVNLDRFIAVLTPRRLPLKFER